MPDEVNDAGAALTFETHRRPVVFAFLGLDFVARKSGHVVMERTLTDRPIPLTELMRLYLLRCDVEGKSVRTGVGVDVAGGVAVAGFAP